MARQAALLSADLSDVRRSGQDFLDEFPGLNARNLAWGSRLFSRGARDAFSLAVMSDHQQAIKVHGARPCCRCGAITHAWCEGCDGPERRAVCSRCDDSGILCHCCTTSNKLWHQVQKEVEPNVAEISGFMHTDGHFVSFHPVLKVDLTTVPPSEVQSHLDEKIAEHYQKLQEGTASSSS